ncbi:MAG: pyruvate kinase [Bacteroidales bacterium]|nr:pyruvate kinase [Anaerotignum sp.]MCI5678517.1 pyruvate kinase [Bacteroidales bacterium]MDY3926362.1 pyruvate kinase [Anaerotignum sp.]
MRRTKIVCTLGPATNDVEIMKKLIENGLDAARINFSHGTYESHAETIAKLKQAREELNAPIPLILDTKGPEIRIKTFKEGKVRLEEDARFTLTTREVEGDETIVSVTYADLPKDLQKGSRVLIDDGLIELRVDSIEDTDVHCTVINGGNVSSRKGVNLPGVKVNLPSLMEKDISDLKFGVENGFDIVAASFIRSAADVVNIRRVLEENGGENIHIISKIENQEGVENIDSILEVSDGIMVARGDLGVEIPPEEVPLVQKRLIAKANMRGKPVITATQMLESMVHSPRPTRAEANDVANAIFDGSDAIMLSGETAAGAYPLEAVETMARIAKKTESSIDYGSKMVGITEPARVNITNAISRAACNAAAELNTAAISTITRSGFTARMISKHRPVCPLLASTSDERVWRQMNLIWGCKPLLYHGELPKGGVFDTALKIAVSSGMLKNGDTVVSALGMPLGFSGATNTLRVDIVGDVLCKGKGVGTKKVSGTARVITTRDGVERTFHKGDILVTTATDSSFMPYIQKAAAIVVGPMDQNVDCHAEIAGSALDIPVIVCNAKVVDFIPAHSLITVDAEKGFVYKGIPKED